MDEEEKDIDEEMPDKEANTEDSPSTDEPVNDEQNTDASTPEGNDSSSYNNKSGPGLMQIGGLLNKKILIGIIASLIFPALIFIGGIIVVLLLIAPILNFIQGISDFSASIADFFSENGNAMGDREFIEEKSQAQIDAEKKLQDKVTEIYNIYSGRGVTLDIPLLLSTLYTPLSVTYDEDTWTKYNNPDQVEVVDPVTDTVTLISKNTKKLKALARHMVSIYKTEFACIENKDQTTGVVTYTRGDLLTNTEYTNEELPTNVDCSKDNTTAIVYSYMIDIDKYDTYLVDTYLPATESDMNEYEIPTSLSGDEKTKYLEQIVIKIHDTSKFIVDLLDIDIPGYDNYTAVSRYQPSFVFTDTQMNVQYYNQGNYSTYYYGTGYYKENGERATISSHGCGPTSMAIILSSMTGTSIDPIVTTEYACDNGYCTSGGTSVNLMCNLAQKYNLDCEYVGKDPVSLDKVVQALSSGNSLVVGYMGVGAFTKGGHYIVLRGVLNDVGSYTLAPQSVGPAPYILVADPASTVRSNEVWSLSLIASQAKTGDGNQSFTIITKR